MHVYVSFEYDWLVKEWISLLNKLSQVKDAYSLGNRKIKDLNL